MSEFRKNIGSSEKSTKRSSGGTFKKRRETDFKKNRNSSTDGERKSNRSFTKNRDDKDSRPKKHFDKESNTEESKTYRKNSRETDLKEKRPRIIKRNAGDSNLRTRKRFENSEENEGTFQKKKIGNRDNPPYKKSFGSKEEKSSHPISRNSEKTDYKTGKRVFNKRSNDKSDENVHRSFKSGLNKNYRTSEKREKYSNESEIKKSTAKIPVRKKERDKMPDTNSIRLNRYIALSGICSRREADELIEVGEVKVNGQVVTEMGTKVSTFDTVEVNGKKINPEKKVYVVLNKPKDFVSTVSDPHADRTVLDLIKLEGHERIYPVGRLDKNTTGVMLLTNDGELTKKLTHPSYNKKKVYHVILNEPATKAQLQQILEGFELEDGFINVDSISFVKEGDKKEIGIELHSGRNRIVRRIFEHLGLRVEKLDRVYFAGLTKKNLPRGKWRFLTDKEIGMLKQGAYE